MAGGRVAHIFHHEIWKISLTHGSVTLVYDGDGNRVWETVRGSTTKYLADNLNPTGLPQVMDERLNNAVSRTYAYGLQRLSENQKISNTWTPSFYGYDGHGNVRFLANKVPSITDSYDYDAFGMPIRTSGTTPNQFLYSGERSDTSIGLYDLRARYYNQATGRFWARDSVEGTWCSPLTQNPYIYAWANPANRTDPTGREALVDYEVNTSRTPEEEVGLRVLSREIEVQDCKFTCYLECAEWYYGGGSWQYNILFWTCRSNCDAACEAIPN